MPDTPEQCGAPDTSRMGLPVRLASARPRSSVANHWMVRPSGGAVGAVRVSGPPPRGARLPPCEPLFWAITEVHTINAANTESREWFRITGVVEIVGAPRDAQQANSAFLTPMAALPPAQPISPMARAASITSTAMAIATCTIMPIWIGPRRGTGSVGPKVLEVLNDRNR